MTDKTVIVIGAGAAGMIAAGRLRLRHKNVIIIEKNGLFGKKLRITGKGRCNITNTAEIEDIIGNIPTNPSFMYSAVYSFTNTDVIELMNSLGVKTKVERGGRVFPESDSAKDVAEALKRYALGENVRVIHAAAEKLETKDSRICGVWASGNLYKCDSVVIATGGISYPLTGSTGDGYKMANAAGHKIVAPKASLVPLVTKEKWVSDLMGLSLKNVEIKLFDGKRRIYDDFGEMLFTHFGISGPIVLSASAHLKGVQDAKIFIDLKPALTEKQLDIRILRDFDKFKNKHIINSLDELLPKALIPVIVRLSEIEPHKEVCSVTREERKRLLNLIKALPLNISGTRPISEAIITSGGVDVSEINPSTMGAKLVHGLFFAGEVIDVDAYTGGFNLQIAFSTGYLAGENA